VVTHGTSYPILWKLGGIQAGDPQISLPDKTELIRQKVTQGLNRTHELAEKAYSTHSKLVEFSVGQVVKRKNYRQSNKDVGYNARLGPNRIRCVVLQRKGKSLYELGDAVGKSVGVFHAKVLYVAWPSERNPTTPGGDKLRNVGLHELIEGPDHMMRWTRNQNYPDSAIKAPARGRKLTRHNERLSGLWTSNRSCSSAQTAPEGIWGQGVLSNVPHGMDEWALQEHQHRWGVYPEALGRRMNRLTRKLARRSPRLGILAREDITLILRKPWVKIVPYT